MSNPSLTQLFEESCDPHAYIPRRETEEVLKFLSSLIQDSEPLLTLEQGFLETSKKQLAGDTVREATSGEVKGLRSENRDDNICGNTTRSNRFDGVPRSAPAFEPTCGPIFGEHCVNR